MALFSIRRTIAALAAVVTLGATFLGHAAQATPYGSKYLQVYSMSYVGDARSKAWEMKNRGFEQTQIFQANNGYYAVVVGRLPHGSEAYVHQLKSWGKIPHDSFLTSGGAYDHEVSLHKKHVKPTQYHGYKPAKPHAQKVYVPKHKPQTHHGYRKVIVYGY